MAVANEIFPYAIGRWIARYDLPAGSDNIIIVLVQSTGLQADTTLVTYRYLDDLLNGTNLEATFTNYARIVLSGADITITTNTTTKTTVVDIPDQVILNAGGPLDNTIGMALTCYRPLSSSPDSDIELLSKHNAATPTNGQDIDIVIPSIGSGKQGT